MLRRLGRHSRYIYIGIILQQNEKKEESKIGVNEVRTEEVPAFDFIRNFNFKKFKDFFIKQDPDIGVSDSYNRIKENISTEYTGWDRLSYLFDMSQDYDSNPNIQFIFKAANIGFFLGFFHGGLREYMKAINLFILSNDATKFSNEMHAKSRLSLKGIEGFMKGGLLTAPKVGCLTFIFCFVQTVISEYRGKNGLMDFPIAGGVTVAIMKWNLGIRGMISGFCSGLLSGLILSPILYVVLLMSGLTISDAKYIAYKLEKEKKALKIKRQKDVGIGHNNLEKMYHLRTKHLPPGFSVDQ